MFRTLIYLATIKNVSWLCCLLLLLAACTPRLESRFLHTEDLQILPPLQAQDARPGRLARSSCYDALSYVPDTAHLEHTPIKYVRVNFHWMNGADSSLNYTGQQAIDYTYELLGAINHDLENNQPMALPEGNNTPVLPTRYRFVITPRWNDPADPGIYFHFDDATSYYVHKGKNINIHRRDAIQKYGIQSDEVLNIFIMPHHPDSVASETYNAYAVGVSLGNAVKAAGMFENGGNPWYYRGIFNHEIGHVFGLAHTWAFNDGCEDTPHNPNCWSRTDEPPCNTVISNNLMDYNSCQCAWTPCQIGKIHLRMAQENAPQRRFLQPNWCHLHEERHIFIRDSVVWHGAKDLEGHLTIETGGSLTIKCRVSLPASAKITVQPGGTLRLEEHARLHNACGDTWQGIEIQQRGKAKGQVITMGKPAIEDAVHYLN
ncbi:MAG TPA: M43 family zinc metalloprotease [Saprospiraceae bacterium]|nr:M43 family zinc metalloprotease [Saprospiraceae bacterium]HMP23965.1 M43 family zinc metalloprotease [Saprospiraceae bacterium]